MQEDYFLQKYIKIDGIKIEIIRGFSFFNDTRKELIARNHKNCQKKKTRIVAVYMRAILLKTVFYFGATTKWVHHEIFRSYINENKKSNKMILGWLKKLYVQISYRRFFS